jgi:hypothetical protein
MLGPPMAKEVEFLLTLGRILVYTTYHISTGMTPFQALYGRLPPIIPSYNEGLSLVHEVDQQLQDRDELLQQLKVNLAHLVNRMKQIADTKRRDVSFDVGDLILLKLRPYRQHTVFKREYQKLASRFYGPYEIMKKIRLVAYKLHLSAESRIHMILCLSAQTVPHQHRC